MRIFDTILYDSPDGEKCLEKTADLTAFGAKIGAIWSIPDLILKTKPTTAMGIARTVVRSVAPAAGMGATFAATSCLMGQIRGKDSPLNHAVGAVSALSIVAMRTSPSAIVFYVLPVGIIAAIFKAAKMDGHNLLHDSHKTYKEFGGYNHYERRIGYRKEVKEPTNY